MNEVMENRLEAWGRLVRGDRIQLKRMRLSQSRYGVEPAGAFVEHLDFVQWHNDAGELVTVPMDEANLAGKIVGSMSAEYGDPLRVRYLDAGTNAQKAARRGESLRTFHRRVSDARAMFSMVWVGVTRGVVQRGALIRVDVEDCDFPDQQNSG